MSPDPSILALGDAIVPVGALSVLATLAVLLVRSGEGVRRTWIMRAFALMLVAQLAVLLVNTATLYLGSDYFLRDWVRVIVYASIPVSQIFIAWIIVRLTDQDRIRRDRQRSGGMDPELDDTVKS